VVGERGFEPPTPWSRTRCSTRLSHSPTDEPTVGIQSLPCDSWDRNFAFTCQCGFLANHRRLLSDDRRWRYPTHFEHSQPSDDPGWKTECPQFRQEWPPSMGIIKRKLPFSAQNGQRTPNAGFTDVPRRRSHENRIVVGKRLYWKVSKTDRLNCCFALRLRFSKSRFYTTREKMQAVQTAQSREW
jgi:hypothetical protein